jgi:probable F420-dependent oxidoreductase
MRIGVVFPQTEIGPDPEGVRAYAEAVTQLGYTHILAYDHVVGADPAIHTPWNGPYDIDTPFHEPFVLFGFLAGITPLEVVTGILILPQRQTALVAKQAAEVDLLTNGRFRLGVGVGWNRLEYDVLGQDFTNRGRRIEEQIDRLRELWTERSVTVEGPYESIDGAGICPRPVQRPIPVWMGASSAPAFRRVGRMADGWFPMVQPGDKLDAALDHVRAGAAEVGRDLSSLGMEGRLDVGRIEADDLAERTTGWRDAGATHLTLNTMRAGLVSVDDHIDALRRAAAVVLA